MTFTSHSGPGSSRYSPGPGHPVCKSRAFVLLRLPDDAWQAVVEPLRFDRNARDGDRAKPEPAAEAHRDCRMVFHYVIELLPSILQAALLLRGCVLSRYLWKANVTVASAVVGVTSFSVTCYLFIVIAGLPFESCPYQTPGISTLCHICCHFLTTPHSASYRLTDSYCCLPFIEFWEKFEPPWYSIHNITSLTLFLLMPITFARDVYHLGRGIPLQLVGFGDRIRRLLASFGKAAYCLFRNTPQAGGLDQHIITLDLQCM